MPAARWASSFFCARTSALPGYCDELPSVTHTTRTSSPCSDAWRQSVPPMPRTSSSGCAAKTRTFMRAPSHPRRSDRTFQTDAGIASDASSESRPDRYFRRTLYLLEHEPALPAGDDRLLAVARDHGSRRSILVELDRPRPPDNELLVPEVRERAGVRPRLRAHPVVEVGRPRFPVDDPVRGSPLRPGARPARVLRGALGGAVEQLRDTLPDELEVRGRDLLVQRRRGLVGSDGQLDLADDRAGIGGFVRQFGEGKARLCRGRSGSPTGSPRGRGGGATASGASRTRRAAAGR